MRKTHNLDSFYVEIKPQIRLAGAYLQQKEFPFLLTMCRLKPYAVLYPMGKPPRLHKWWIDEWGNSLHIKSQQSKKYWRIVLDDPLLQHKTLGCTDLYYCLSLHQMLKISRWVFILVGKDLQQQDHIVIGSLGIDNFLRVHTLIQGRWQQVSPLQLGAPVLKWIARHQRREPKLFHYTKPEKIIWSCTTQQAWLCYWESKEQLQEIMKQHPILEGIIQERNG